MADTKLSDMTSASTPDGTELAYVVQSSADRKITLSAIVNWFLSLANTFTRQQTITPAANESAVIASGYSLTGANAQNLLDLSGTWNTTGAPDGIKLNITDTASGTGSALADFQVGGVSKVTVGMKNFGRDTVTFDGGSMGIGAVNSGIMGIGNVASPAVGVTGSPFTVRFIAAATIGFTSSNYTAAIDTPLARDAAGVLAQRNGVSAQDNRLYNTFTDAANYERFTVSWQATTNTATIGVQALGTGTLRPVAAVGSWTFNSPVKTAVLTVSTLPSASTAGSGARSFVSDALAPAFGSTVVTGGAIAAPVYSDGTNWKVG